MRAVASGRHHQVDALSLNWRRSEDKARSIHGDALLPSLGRLLLFNGRSLHRRPYTGGIVILKNYQLLTLPLTARPGRHSILNKDKMLTSLQLRFQF
jgi:hypothetical protein